MHKVFFEFSSNFQVHLIQAFQHEHCACYYILAWFTEKGRINFLHPDICSNYFRNARQLISADQLLEGKISATYASGEKKCFMIPTAQNAFLYYLIKRIGKNNLTEEHYKYLQDQYRKAPDCAQQELKKSWPENSAGLIQDAFSSNNFHLIQGKYIELEKSLRKKNPLRLKDFFLDLKLKIKRIFHPTGICIAFLGPDGSGKSTIIGQIQEQMAPAFRKTAYIHLRPTILRRKQARSETIENPHGQPARGKTASFAKLLFFLFDYTAGFCFRIMPMKIRSTMVIFDRYYYDLLADPIRYRYSAPMWAASLIGKLIPKPDLTFILDAPPEILQKRKKEVTFAETKKQRKRYALLCKNLRHCYLIDTNQPLDEVCHQVEAIIIDCLSHRAKKRFGKTSR